ncbi:MAG: hypothetical protein Q8Q35_01255 [Nanoarchaeota archaeon]|nr:hypothetical protein [Nanoarchaeota archaeon]
MSHIARNIIVTLDFDGCVALGEPVKIKYAKIYHNIDVTSRQIVKETYPIGKDKYKELMDKVTTEHIMEYVLDSQCKEVLDELYVQGFRFAVVTSRTGPELEAAKQFCKINSLPISYYHATSNSPKTIICKKLKSRAMIDDSLLKLIDLIDTPLHLFFLKREWNKHEKVSGELKNLVSVVSNWGEFYSGLLDLRNLHEAVCYYNHWRNNFAHVQRISDFIKSDPKTAKVYLSDYTLIKQKLNL